MQKTSSAFIAFRALRSFGVLFFLLWLFGVLLFPFRVFRFLGGVVGPRGSVFGFAFGSLVSLSSSPDNSWFSSWSSLSKSSSLWPEPSGSSCSWDTFCLFDAFALPRPRPRPLPLPTPSWGASAGAGPSSGSKAAAAWRSCFWAYSRGWPEGFWYRSQGTKICLLKIISYIAKMLYIARDHDQAEGQCFHWFEQDDILIPNVFKSF